MKVAAQVSKLLRQASRQTGLYVLSFLALGATAAGESPLVQIPFEYAKNWNSILVHARVNGKPALLVLDTGAAHVVLRPEFLGLSHDKLHTPQPAPAGGGAFGDAVGHEVSLEFGHRRWLKWRVAVMDLSNLLSVYSEKIDGLLGLDFLQQFPAMTIDLDSKTITFGASKLSVYDKHRLPVKNSVRAFIGLGEPNAIKKAFRAQHAVIPTCRRAHGRATRLECPQLVRTG